MRWRGAWWKVCLVMLLVAGALDGAHAAGMGIARDADPFSSETALPSVFYPSRVALPITAQTRASYYIDSIQGSDSNAGTSPERPWQTLAALESHAFRPGDAINLARGSEWQGRVRIGFSGEPGNPITIQAYGTGPRPILRGRSRGSVMTLSGQWLVVQGLLIRDGQEAAIKLEKTAEHNVIRDIEATAVGIGFYVAAEYTLITQDYAHDLRMVVNTPGGNDDYGALGVLLAAPNNEISRNRFVKCRASSWDYGRDGGAVELFGTVDNSRIHHNYVQDTQGFIEVGGPGRGSARNVLIGYNLVINSGRVVGFHLAGDFATSIDNFRFANNTIVDTSGQYLDALFYQDGGNRTLDRFVMRNNIFYLSTFDRVMRGSQAFTHEHNIYFMTAGEARLGYKPGPGEQIADPLFVDVAAGNFRLRADSPAISAGVNADFAEDFDGSTLPDTRTPDIGAFGHSPK